MLRYPHTVLTGEVALGEEVLQEVRAREQQLVQFVHTHPHHCVNVEPTSQITTERLHLTWNTHTHTHLLNNFCINS